jgi:NADPH:quinone reductase-like Zn-dependent oxidoreductase
MRAAITPAFGGPELLELHDLPTPAIGPDEVRIRVRAAAVTEGDRRLRAADVPTAPPQRGRLFVGLFKPRRPVQGSIFAGRIEAVGANVTRWAPGQDVFGLSEGFGAYAEQLVVPAEGPMAAMPEGVSYTEAVAVPYGAGTALHFLTELARVQPGERVLVLGASGGVGRFAVQLARHLGAEVTGVASGRNEALVRALGAHDFIDHRTQDFTALGRSWDVVFDIADASSFAHSRPVLTPQGRYLTLYMSVDAMVQMALTKLRGGPRALFAVAQDDAERLGAIRDLLAQGVIPPRVGPTFALEDIRAAHAAADARGQTGCIVVTMDGPPQLRAVG